jgi:hypothetical protein
MKPQLVAFAISLILSSASAAMAQTVAGTELCLVWHRFEPGPIVDGHRRQPTPGEVEARTRELRALSKIGACTIVPISVETITLRPPSARSPDQVVESDLPSLRGTQ